MRESTFSSSFRSTVSLLRPTASHSASDVDAPSRHSTVEIVAEAEWPLRRRETRKAPVAVGAHTAAAGRSVGRCKLQFLILFRRPSSPIESRNYAATAKSLDVLRAVCAISVHQHHRHHSLVSNGGCTSNMSTIKLRSWRFKPDLDQLVRVAGLPARHRLHSSSPHRLQWSFRRTLASQAEIVVWVQAPRALVWRSAHIFLRSYMQNHAIQCILAETSSQFCP